MTYLDGFAQNRGTLMGKVIDERSKESMVGVNVIILDTNWGVSTNLNGEYSIENVPVETYRMCFDYIWL